MPLTAPSPIKSALFVMLIALTTQGCSISPVHTPSSPTRGKREFRLRPERKGVVFTLLMRRVAVSRSQGKPWVLRRNEEEYLSFEKKFRTLVTEKTGMELLPNERILDHTLYLDGFFPLKVPFYINPSRLPIVTNQKEEEYMLRMSRSLEDPYFLVVLADSSVTKTMFTPATVKAILDVTIYDYTGPLRTLHLKAKRKVLPVRYSFLPDRANPGYEERMGEALTEAFDDTLDQLALELEALTPDRSTEARDRSAPRQTPP